MQDVAENLLCAGREETFEFLAKVIEEVAALFPSPYLHMGGDERPEGPQGVFKDNPKSGQQYAPPKAMKSPGFYRLK